jgi:glyoxylase-like metal-dependent hydrolase (beta-lactamase superfamily II)
VQRITDGIYSLQGLLVGRVFMIEGSDGLTIIDASLPGSLSKIEKDLQSQGHQLNKVKRILITHAHPDHIGSLGALKKATGAAVYVHRRDASVVRGDEPIVMPKPQDLQGTTRVISSMMRPPKMEPASVERELQEGDTLDEVMPGLCVVDTPGHSPGHVGFWLPSKRLLFGGDVVMRLFGKMRLPLGPATVDMAQAKRSIRKIADMDIDILCQGHGAPHIGNASAALRQFAGKIGV